MTDLKKNSLSNSLHLAVGLVIGLASVFAHAGDAAPSTAELKYSLVCKSNGKASGHGDLDSKRTKAEATWKEGGYTHSAKYSERDSKSTLTFKIFRTDSKGTEILLANTTVAVPLVALLASKPDKAVVVFTQKVRLPKAKQMTEYVCEVAPTSDEDSESTGDDSESGSDDGGLGGALDDFGDFDKPTEPKPKPKPAPKPESKPEPKPEPKPTAPEVKPKPSPEKPSPSDGGDEDGEDDEDEDEGSSQKS